MALAARISTRVNPVLAGEPPARARRNGMFLEIFIVLSHFYNYIVVNAPLDVLALFAHSRNYVVAGVGENFDLYRKIRHGVHLGIARQRAAAVILSPFKPS